LEKKFHFWSSGGAKAIKTLITFGIISLTWVLFRSDQIQDAFFIYSNLAVGLRSFVRRTLATGFDMALLSTLFSKIQYGLSSRDLSILLIGLPTYLGISQLKARINFFNRPFWFRWTLYIFLAIIIWFLNTSQKIETFVYFKF
jgi:hypothetical protein